MSSSGKIIQLGLFLRYYDGYIPHTHTIAKNQMQNTHEHTHTHARNHFFKMGVTSKLHSLLKFPEVLISKIQTKPSASAPVLH